MLLRLWYLRRAPCGRSAQPERDLAPEQENCESDAAPALDARPMMPALHWAVPQLLARDSWAQLLVR